MANRFRDPFALQMERQRSTEPFVLAARIRSQGPTRRPRNHPGPDRRTKRQPTMRMRPPRRTRTADKINVVYVTDIDMMHSEFLRVRAQPKMGDINWQFDNVTFVLNVIDSLAGDDRFLDIRKRKTRYASLKKVEERTAEAREEAEGRDREIQRSIPARRGRGEEEPRTGHGRPARSKWTSCRRRARKAGPIFPAAKSSAPCRPPCSRWRSKNVSSNGDSTRPSNA